MQKNLQRKPKLNYSENVIDIVQFGSSVILNSNPNDVDIAVIFKAIPLKNQLEESQKIKKQLELTFNLPVHIKSYDFYSLFDDNNFAREGILFYGKSIINSKYLSEIFGIVPKLQISYSLKSLEKKDKIRFNYLLNGRGKKYGLLREYEGSLLKPGLIEIKPEQEKIFVERISEITPNFEIKKMFAQIRQEG